MARGARLKAQSSERSSSSSRSNASRNGSPAGGRAQNRDPSDASSTSRAGDVGRVEAVGVQRVVRGVHEVAGHCISAAARRRGAHEVGLHHAGVEHRNRYLRCGDRELASQGLGDGDGAGFARRVGRRVRRGHHARHRRGDDDAGRFAVLDHRRHRVADAADEASQVDGEREVEDLVGGLPGGATGAGDAGVSDTPCATGPGRRLALRPSAAAPDR